MTKENVIVKVQESLGSLFTKDDVIKCLNMVVEEPKVESQPTDFQAVLNLIKDRIVDAINSYDFNDSDNLDIYDMEFSISYGNTIELDSFEVNARTQKDNLMSVISEAFNDLEEEHQTRLEIVAENN
jgi:hypothetical protein